MPPYSAAINATFFIFLNHVSDSVCSYKRNDKKIYLNYVGGEVPLHSQGVIEKFLELTLSKNYGVELLVFPVHNNSTNGCLTQL